MKKSALALFAAACIASAENTISFNTVFSDSTGKFSFTYPIERQELLEHFIKQKFGEKFVGEEPKEALTQYKKENKEIKYMSDVVSFPLPGIVQYSTTSYAELGGAHGITAYTYEIYSLSNEKKIELRSLFNKNWEKNISKMIIKEFLQQQNIQALEDYSYTQKEEDFMPESARYAESGIEFVYAPYKIAPYSAGEQSVFLSWNTLKPYLNKKSAIFKKIKF